MQYHHLPPHRRYGHPLNLTHSLLILGALFLFSSSLYAATSVIYDEPQADLRVKVLGGSIVIQRSFVSGLWLVNRAWVPLSLTVDPVDGSIKGITRGRVEYTKVSPGVFTFRKRDTIRQTGSGFRWSDRHGNVIDYNTQGLIQSYEDRHHNKVSFTYETVNGTPRLKALKDPVNREVLFFDYTTNQLTKIRDYTGREVRYQYTGLDLTTVIDANGNSWVYGYTSNIPTRFTDPEGRLITRSFANNGELASIRYTDGTGMDYSSDYDEAKLLFYRQEKSTSGRRTETWTNPEGDITRQDLNGKTLFTLTTDTQARTKTETDARGLKTTRFFDEWDNQTGITYPDGTTQSTQVDPLYSNPTQRIDERGTITQYNYDTNGNLLTLTEAKGLPEERITTYTYDTQGQRKTETRVGGTLTLPDNSTLIIQDATSTYEYDDSGNTQAFIDPEGYRTEWTNFDAMGNPQTSKDARGKIWERTYDKRGYRLTDKDPLAHVTRNTYDKAGWLTKTIDAVSNDTLYQYDLRKNLITRTDPYGALTRYTYNQDNQQLKQTDPEGKSQTTEYDLDGRRTKTIDGNNNTVQYLYGTTNSGLDNLLTKVIYPTFSQEFKYDTRTRLTQTIDVLDTATRLTTTTTYDATGNRLSVTDKEGNTTSYTYDPLSRLRTITDSLSGITTYTYDQRDNLIALSDANQHLHRFSYDKRNLKTEERRPLGQITRYTYTPLGNLDSLSDPQGQLERYGYDEIGKLIEEKHYQQLSDTTPIKSIVYGYTDLGRLRTWSDGLTSGTTQYDSRQLKNLGKQINYGSFNLSYSFDYYANGLKKSFTGPDNIVITYSYDANNQLTTIGLPVGNVTVNQYRWSAPQKTTFPGGSIRTQDHDPLLRLTNFTVKDPAQNPLLEYAYTYDKVDNVKTKQTEQGSSTYNYDKNYRLTDTTNPSPLANEAYTYDAMGNRVTDSTLTGSLQYNANDQITSGISVTYDANGNIQTKTEGNLTTTYTYDLDNRLINITRTDNTTTTIATYAYDPFGRRLWKEVNNNRTYFLYSEEGLIAEADANGALTTLYGYKPGTAWGTNPVYLKTNNQYYFYQTDQLGTSQKLHASDGTIVWSQRALAFGMTTVDATSTITNNLRFPGQYFDQESGLHYNWNRHYDPSLGRYLTTDPLTVGDYARIVRMKVANLSAANAGSSQFNPYAYVNNNPLRWSDPTGLFPLIPIGIGLGRLLLPRVLPYLLPPLGGLIFLIKNPGGGGGGSDEGNPDCPPDDPKFKACKTYCQGIFKIELDICEEKRKGKGADPDYEICLDKAFTVKAKCITDCLKNPDRDNPLGPADPYRDVPKRPKLPPDDEEFGYM